MHSQYVDLAAVVRRFADHPESVRVLRKYYSGAYTGALFDTGGALRSPDPNRFTHEDLLAVATLSVPLQGRSVEAMIARADSLADLLQKVRDVHIADSSDADLAELFELQRALDEVPGVGPVTRSKLLARKRPSLVPIRDQHVLRAFGIAPNGSLTEPLRSAVRADRSALRQLARVREEAGVPDIADLRVLDVIVWMLEHGDAQVAD